ncbi:putative NADPH-dependent methylglyoxal reductase GRP2 [Candida viswanathii]|uniref:Putative NADPH-dependent methylglyoxal reductase GRP2 n=1 Tax=Candida viswanathii TaxID=5486 RepID=A0A367YIC2_9ASCO|nr:putative NADPH-dependent methylglyoxal reductase GRP2 [Candida viswanathii]
MLYQHRTSVFVTGASGYIAQHIIKQLIEKGYYVVGSVISKEKGEALTRLIGPLHFTYEVVPDVSAVAAFAEALQRHQDVRYFIHTATPYTFNPDYGKNEEMLQKAVDAIHNTLQSVHTTAHRSARSKVYNEYDWNPLTWEESLDPGKIYYGGKKFGELAAWDYKKRNYTYYKLTVINPVYVFGPQAYDFADTATLATTAERVSCIANLSKEDPIPESWGAYVDVRDVARAHVLALENDETSNRRLLLVAGAFSNDKIAHIINEKFPNCKVPMGT